MEFESRCMLTRAFRYVGLAAVIILMAGCATTSEVKEEEDPRYEMITPSGREVAGEFFSALGGLVTAFSKSNQDSRVSYLEYSYMDLGAGGFKNSRGGRASRATSVNAEGNGLGERRVVVEGVGNSRSEARDDAIREAMLSTVGQLVISDRLVQDSELIRNEVLATQNGFVERFEVQDEFINERGEVVLKARVDVSESTIVNYVAAQHAQTSHVDGASLMAEIQRNTNHREALKAMFRRFFRGYPSEVVSLEMAEMVPVRGQSDKVRATIRASSDANYFIAMQQFLERVSVLSYRTPLGFEKGFRYPQVGDFLQSDVISTTTVPQGGLRVPSTYPSTQVCSAPRPRLRTCRVIGEMVDGVTSDGRLYGRCYLMPPGDFISAALTPEDKPIGSGPKRHIYNLWDEVGLGGRESLLVAFMDAQGRSAVNDGAPGKVGGCMILGGGRGAVNSPGMAMFSSAPKGTSRYGLPFRLHFQGNRSGKRDQAAGTIILSDTDAYYSVVFSVDHVDFDRVQSFVGAPVILLNHDGKTQVLKEPWGETVSVDEACQELLARRNLS